LERYETARECKEKEIPENRVHGQTPRRERLKKEKETLGERGWWVVGFWRTHPGTNVLEHVYKKLKCLLGVHKMGTLGGLFCGGLTVHGPGALGALEKMGTGV